MPRDFQEILFDTPECEEFRKLADGSWVAYSCMMPDRGGHIFKKGKTVEEALLELRKELGYEN